MKRFVFAIMLVLAIVGSATVTVSAAGPRPTQPVIVAEMPDCYMPIGSDGITLFTNVSVPDGGTLKYQWYVTDIENMAMIRAIDYAEGDSYQVPEELGVKWYCYAAWNVVGGLESEPTYSRLIRVEFYENSSPHTHSFGEWMVTTNPTCTEAGIKTRECDCGVTERAEVPAAGHNWDAGTITREPSPKADGEKTYSCLELDRERQAKEKDTEQTSPVKNERVSFPWWIVAVIAAVVIGAGVLAVVLIRKKALIRKGSDEQ